MSLRYVACLYSFCVLLIAKQSRQAELTANEHIHSMDALEASNRSGRKESYDEHLYSTSAPGSYLWSHASVNEYSPLVSSAEIVYSQRIPDSLSKQSGDIKEKTASSGRNGLSSGDSSVNAESEKSSPSEARLPPATHPTRSITRFEPRQRSHPWGPYQVRGDHYNRGPGLSQSDSNVDWSIWESEPPSDSGKMKKTKGGMPSPPPGPSYHHYHHFDKIWKDDPWKDMPPMMPPDMMMMMMKGGMMPDDKRKSLLDKLGNLDPMKILLVGAVPLSLILAAILPTLMNMMMNNNMNPTISTIATGGGGRELENSLLQPVIKAMEDLGSATMDDSYCFQKMFCKVATESNLSNPVREVFYKTSALVEDRWLEAFGLKSMLEAIAAGKCERINCPRIWSRAPKKADKDSHQQKVMSSQTVVLPK